jgi:hypothetical protein
VIAIFLNGSSQKDKKLITIVEEEKTSYEYITATGLFY